MFRSVMLIPTWIGAAAGLALFVFVGAVSRLLYGGYAGLAMAAVLTGTPVEPTLLAKLIIFGGMALGAVAAFFFCEVLGAFSGTLAGLPFMPLLRRWEERRLDRQEVPGVAVSRQPAAEEYPEIA